MGAHSRGRVESALGSARARPGAQPTASIRAGAAFAPYLLGHEPPAVEWEARWLRWPDFRLPSDRMAAAEALREAWARAEHERVEIACSGGRGRTGTALACLAVLDGVPGREAVDYVRAHYSPHAVETPWQRRYVSRFS
jgi:protein-tyrosine phosphatase